MFLAVRQKDTFKIIRKLRMVTIPRKELSKALNTDAVVERCGNAGVITLNRPKALNALNLPMIHTIYPQLKEWENDADVKIIIMKGAGEKAFCAGGDVRAIAEAGKKGDPLTKTFFKEEYMLNHRIGTLKTPLVALINGITMGGGVGLSVHGEFRIASQKTLFAMPETAIGFFPDVGGGYFLPRLAGKLGNYLALTGHRLKGRDVYHAGVATHFVNADMMPDLEKELVNVSSASDIKDVINDFHSRCVVEDDVFSLQAHKEEIDRIFGGKSVSEIMKNLKDSSSEWSAKQLKLMGRMSPMSMCVTLEQLARGSSLSFADVFTMEYRISQKFMTGEDFYEGIRAVLVDKDNQPTWSPKDVDEVSEDKIQEYFLPLSDNQDLVF